MIINMIEKPNCQSIPNLVYAAFIAGMIALVCACHPMTASAPEDRECHTGVKQSDGERLKRLALKILDARYPPYSLKNEITDLTRLLDDCATVRFDPYQDISTGETRTENGLALSPVMAAMCVQDIARTVVFMRGLHAAIQDCRNRSLDRPTRVLYVGCGPYAVLALPSMAVFSPQEVRFTLLDIHAPSIDSARSVVNAFALGEYVASYEIMDAKRYHVPKGQSPDVTIMEIMNAGLEKEPQVAITRHLLSQVPNTVIVPESVRVDAYLVDVSKEFSFVDPRRTTDTTGRDRFFLGKIFELSRKTVTLWKNEGNARLPAASIKMPDPLEDRYTPMFFTTIQVYGTHCLKDYDSGLTIPRPMPINKPLRGADVVRFYYRLGSHPALICE
jgi:hypothetical protein